MYFISINSCENGYFELKNKRNKDYVSHIDMGKTITDSSRAVDIIKNWLRSRTTLECLSSWEMFYNPNFKVVEFDHVKKEDGLHTF